MKINPKVNSIRQIVLVVLAMSLIAMVYTERMETIASFKSNFKLAKKTNKEKQAFLTGGHVPTVQKSKPAPSSKSSMPIIPPINIIPAGVSDETLIKRVGDDLPDVPIYYQGWVKYFRYMENGKEKPKTFFKNSAFSKQQIGNKAITEESDQYGPNKIPSEKHFFLVMYKDTINILTARDNSLVEVADSLVIDFIKTIPEDNNYQGGIKDFGKFSEGSCFEVATIKPGAFFQMSASETEPSTGLRETWLICTEEDMDKKQMMNLLIKLKLKKQHNVGVYVSTPTDPLQLIHNGGSLSPIKNRPTITDVINQTQNVADPDRINQPNRGALDGYWIVLQDYTPCTHKCGGGLEYLHLMCVPPKKTGKPCQGESVRTRACNQQPCPKIESIKSLLPDIQSNPNQKVEKAIIKMMPVSNRPQRYDKCYLKETDALMIKSEKAYTSLENIPKIPIRLVMNNKSITVYQDETLQTNMITFLLDNTQFARVKGDLRCFILTGLNDKAQFCQLDTQSGSFVEEWDYDFNLFKFQCKQKRETIKLNKNEDEKLQRDYQDKLNQLKLDMVEQKAQKMKKQVENGEEMKLQKKIQQTQAMTLMAIQKELRLEEMLEKEEMERQKDEQRKLQLQIEAEKRKKDCLTKSIKEKQIEDQMNLTKSNAEDAIQKIKEEAKRQIMVKRAMMKKRLQTLRLKNQRKLTQMQNEIINIRVETAGKVQKSAKIGNIGNCFNPGVLQNAALPKIEEYCQVHFSDNNSKFMECKNPDTFCFLCCENEFGDLHLLEREKCYKNVCESEVAKPSTIILGHNQ